MTSGSLLVLHSTRLLVVCIEVYWSSMMFRIMLQFLKVHGSIINRTFVFVVVAGG
jgi:hypothetical protein